MTDYSELKSKAQEIRDEVKAGANTASRVGLALEETVKALEAENKRAEQVEMNLGNAVQLLQDDTEDLQSIRDEVSRKQNKLDNYREDGSNGSVEIFAQDTVSMRNDSQGGISCVEVYNEEDTEDGLIPVARMSVDKGNGDWASVTVWGNEVHIEGDAVKVNGVELENTTIINDLTTGGDDKALSAEMGKFVGEKLTELETKEASNGYGFDKTIQVGTDAAGSFQFPVGYWLNLKKGDKIYIELSDITLDTGAIVAALWTPSGLDTNYQLRYNAGENQPCRKAFTLKEDTTIRGISMNKSSNVESYSATLRFAGNNAAELYENNSLLKNNVDDLNKIIFVFDKSVDIENDWSAMLFGDVAIEKNSNLQLLIGGGFSANRVIIAGTATLSNRIYDGPVSKEGLLLNDIIPLDALTSIYVYVSGLTNKGKFELKIAKSILGGISTTPIYEVGEGKQYTKVIDAFNAAIGQNEEAEIHIFAGVYDIYEEMGGDEFLQSLSSSISWIECNPTFYKKVKIKGIGDVTLKLEISDLMYESYTSQAKKLAIINTVTGIEVDNIDFQIKNCRYCIHDECDGSIYYNGTEHIFTNCKFYFNNGNAAVGIGASASKYLFKGCCFDTDLSSRSLLYFHTWPNNIGALLKFENCVADAGKVHLSIYNKNHKTRVFFENSYFARQNASVIVQPETNEYTTNIFDIICLNVNFDSIGFAESVAENPYTPKFYKW